MQKAPGALGAFCYPHPHQRKLTPAWYNVGMRNNEEYWKEKYDYMRWKYDFLLKNWQQQLVKEVDQERQIMERDKVIVALQDKVKQLTKQQSTGVV